VSIDQSADEHTRPRVVIDAIVEIHCRCRVLRPCDVIQ